MEVLIQKFATFFFPQYQYELKSRFYFISN